MRPEQLRHLNQIYDKLVCGPWDQDRDVPGLLAHIRYQDARIAALERQLHRLGMTADTARCLWVLENGPAGDDSDIGYAMHLLEVELAEIAAERGGLCCELLGGDGC